MHDSAVDQWIEREAIPFSPDAPNAAFNRVLAPLAVGNLDLLALGEALHGGEEILVLRNRLFQHLIASHGYTAIAIESSFPRGRIVDEYVQSRDESSYDAVRDAGFSHGFGKFDASRELVEWMRAYNADAAHPAKLRFYGFDSPTEMTRTDSPRQLLHFAIDYLAAVDGSTDRRKRIDDLLGDDAAWENPAAMMDPTKSIGLSPAASALRIEAEDLVTELQQRQPELATKTGRDAYLEAVQHAHGGRQMLSYHAGLARQSPTRIADLLGLRDLMMADNLSYAVERERARGGRVFAFAHNSHIKRGQAKWQLGPHALAWWPAGAHMHHRFGPRYAVIGTGVGTSAANGIAEPEPGTLEARLTASPGPIRFVSTHDAPRDAINALPVRTASTKNQSYFPFTADSLTDFNALAVLDSVTYTRGGPPLP